MIFLLDADMNGVDSIAKRIKAGQVTRYACGSKEAFDEACMRLAARPPEPGDRVVLDTYTQMLSTMRADFKHGSDPTASVIANEDKWFGDKQGMNGYQAASNMTMRWPKNLRSVGYDVTVLAHEDEALDEATMTTKRGVKANPEARDMLYAAASDIFRLVENPVDKIEIVNGEPKVVLPKGARLLLLRRTQETLAKYHVDLDLSPKIPDGIKDPTMGKLVQVLDKVPSFLVIYGLPGVGKTTFATSQ